MFSDPDFSLTALSSGNCLTDHLSESPPHLVGEEREGSDNVMEERESGDEVMEGSGERRSEGQEDVCIPDDPSLAESHYSQVYCTPCISTLTGSHDQSHDIT